MGSSAHASDDAAGVWSAVVERLQQNLNDQAYTTWFGSASPRSLDDGTLEVAVPNEFTRAWIEGHFGSLIAAAARDVRGTELDVRFTVAQPPVGNATGADLDPLPSARPVAAEPVGREAARLSANYTFDHFVIGSSNRFAHAAALAVAETPAQSYNPLFLAGSTGLGKTHLLQAIAHYVLEEHAGLRVRYVTCEAFTNDFIDALQEKRLEQFKGRYRAYDVLLVDDIQFLAGQAACRRCLPHFQHAVRVRQPDRAELGSAPEGHLAARGSACARGSSGGSSRTSSRPTSRPAWRSCSRRRTATASRSPTATC